MVNFAVMHIQTEKHSEKELEVYPEVQEICFKVRDQVPLHFSSRRVGNE